MSFRSSVTPGGRPVLELRGRAALLARNSGCAISLSLTHTGSLAMATVVMEN
jgi:phosphopantetheinyl transferase (holo-ACP synthase)